MSKRQFLALIALIGVFLATYLTLYKVGAIGALACQAGSCETVQLSRWATFLGLPVAAWGILFYIVLLALALAGTSARAADSRALSLALLAWTGWGVVFSSWLTYLELFVIRAICQYCVGSAVLVAIAFVVAYLDYRSTATARRALAVK
ncbi:MAG: vitamin K epoxide reductase family protein [Gemmatimonadota bacterium]